MPISILTTPHVFFGLKDGFASRNTYMKVYCQIR